MTCRSEAFADDPGDLAGDELLDELREVPVEPVLEHRPQHLPDHRLERTVAGRSAVRPVAKRGEGGERLAAGGGGIVRDEPVALRDRIAELEHVFFVLAAEGARRLDGTRAPRRARGGGAAVLGD